MPKQPVANPLPFSLAWDAGCGSGMFLWWLHFLQKVELTNRAFDPDYMAFVVPVPGTRGCIIPIHAAELFRPRKACVGCVQASMTNTSETWWKIPAPLNPWAFQKTVTLSMDPNRKELAGEMPFFLQPPRLCQE